MSVFIECETIEKPETDYEGIIRSVVDASIEYVNCKFETQVNVVLLSDEEIRSINREYRDMDAPTDVLSFPAIDFPEGGNADYIDSLPPEEYFDPDTGELILGDIIISVDRAKAQAELYGHSLEREIGFLVAHSMLHLFGYDHVKEAEGLVMEEKQEEILSGLGLCR